MPFPVLAALTLGKKALNIVNARRNGNDQLSTKPKQSMTGAGKARLFLALPFTLTAIAFLLSFLLVFAGSKPGMMEDYSVFMLNTSRIGENILEKVNDRIQGFNLSSIHDKRSEPVSVVAVPTLAFDPLIVETPATVYEAMLPQITSAPSVALRERDVASALNSLTSKAGGAASSVTRALSSKAASLEAAASSEAASIESAASSKVSSAEAKASSAVNSALASAETSIVKAVNKAYHSAIEGLELEGWYAVYISSTCHGVFAFKNGTNVTVGAAYGDEPVHRVTNSCAGHSAINPLQLVRVLYWIAVVLTGIAFGCGVVGTVKPTSRKVALINICALSTAFLFLGLASSITHGVAVGARHLINGIFASIAVSGEVGKFVQLSWATTCLILLSIGFWILAFVFAGRVAESERVRDDARVPWGRKRPDRTSGIALQEFEGPVTSAPMTVHDERGRREWI
ncbi:hypothetical protein B0A48_18137 [Cryoendolithus antarcticus]|uniref:Actin cortical patch SUR7/pH-response regulator PalI n=1 Tax=Cryoendolithus antarcticus TaxID=1507870 RepID=A0A1V8S9P9_9PEZI|nr:hypothetical protein B0A48_18137 [Cryoendolithus antarcticus]